MLGIRNSKCIRKGKYENKKRKSMACKGGNQEKYQENLAQEKLYLKF